MSYRSTPALMALTVLIVLLAAPAAAQQEAVPEDVESISLRLVLPRNEEVPPQLEAVVGDEAGNGVPGIDVDFTRELEFLGTTRRASLGTATTDLGGVARLVVLPREETALVVASVDGSEVSAVIDVVFPTERVNPFFDPDPPPGRLQPLRDLMPPLIAVAVALLWIFVIGLAVRTVSQIKGAGEQGAG